MLAGKTMKLDLLTGGLATPRPVRHQPEHKPDKTDLMLEQMSGMMQYLHSGAKSRAEKAAKPLIEKERTALAAQMKAKEEEMIKRLSHESAKVDAAERRLNSLKALLDETEGSKTELHQKYVSQERALQKLKDTASQNEAKAQKQIEEIQAKLQAMPVAQPAPKALDPEQIQFEWQRGGTGLLNQVILRAEGFEDTAVTVERFPDNRIRGLNVKGV